MYSNSKSNKLTPMTPASFFANSPVSPKKTQQKPSLLPPEKLCFVPDEGRFITQYVANAEKFLKEDLDGTSIKPTAVKEYLKKAEAQAKEIFGWNIQLIEYINNYNHSSNSSLSARKEAVKNILLAESMIITLLTEAFLARFEILENSIQSARPRDMQLLKSYCAEIREDRKEMIQLSSVMGAILQGKKVEGAKVNASEVIVNKALSRPMFLQYDLPMELMEEGLRPFRGWKEYKKEKEALSGRAHHTASPVFTENDSNPFSSDPLRESPKIKKQQRKEIESESSHYSRTKKSYDRVKTREDEELSSSDEETSSPQETRPIRPHTLQSTRRGNISPKKPEELRALTDESAFKTMLSENITQDGTDDRSPYLVGRSKRVRWTGVAAAQTSYGLPKNDIANEPIDRSAIEADVEGPAIGIKRVVSRVGREGELFVKTNPTGWGIEKTASLMSASYGVTTHTPPVDLLFTQPSNSTTGNVMGLQVAPAIKGIDPQKVRQYKPEIFDRLDQAVLTELALYDMSINQRDGHLRNGILQIYYSTKGSSELSLVTKESELQALQPEDIQHVRWVWIDDDEILNFDVEAVPDFIRERFTHETGVVNSLYFLPGMHRPCDDAALKRFCEKNHKKNLQEVLTELDRVDLSIQRHFATLEPNEHNEAVKTAARPLFFPGTFERILDKDLAKKEFIERIRREENRNPTPFEILEYVQPMVAKFHQERARLAVLISCINKHGDFKKAFFPASEQNGKPENELAQIDEWIGQKEIYLIKYINEKIGTYKVSSYEELLDRLDSSGKLRKIFSENIHNMDYLQPVLHWGTATDYRAFEDMFAYRLDKINIEERIGNRVVQMTMQEALCLEKYNNVGIDTGKIGLAANSTPGQELSRITGIKVPENDFVRNQQFNEKKRVQAGRVVFKDLSAEGVAEFCKTYHGDLVDIVVPFLVEAKKHSHIIGIPKNFSSTQLSISLIYPENLDLVFPFQIKITSPESGSVVLRDISDQTKCLTQIVYALYQAVHKESTGDYLTIIRQLGEVFQNVAENSQFSRALKVAFGKLFPFLYKPLYRSLRDSLNALPLNERQARIEELEKDTRLDALGNKEKAIMIGELKKETVIQTAKSLEELDTAIRHSGNVDHQYYPIKEYNEELKGRLREMTGLGQTFYDTDWGKVLTALQKLTALQELKKQVSPVRTAIENEIIQMCLSAYREDAKQLQFSSSSNKSTFLGCLHSLYFNNVNFAENFIGNEITGCQVAKDYLSDKDTNDKLPLKLSRATLDQLITRIANDPNRKQIFNKKIASHILQIQMVHSQVLHKTESILLTTKRVVRSAQVLVTSATDVATLFNEGKIAEAQIQFNRKVSGFSERITSGNRDTLQKRFEKITPKSGVVGLFGSRDKLKQIDGLLKLYDQVGNLPGERAKKVVLLHALRESIYTWQLIHGFDRGIESIWKSRVPTGHELQQTASSVDLDARFGNSVMPPVQRAEYFKHDRTAAILALAEFVSAELAKFPSLEELRPLEREQVLGVVLGLQEEGIIPRHKTHALPLSALLSKLKLQTEKLIQEKDGKQPAKIKAIGFEAVTLSSDSEGESPSASSEELEKLVGSGKKSVGGSSESEKIEPEKIEKEDEDVRLDDKVLISKDQLRKVPVLQLLRDIVKKDALTQILTFQPLNLTVSAQIMQNLSDIVIDPLKRINTVYQQLIDTQEDREKAIIIRDALKAVLPQLAALASDLNAILYENGVYDETNHFGHIIQKEVAAPYFLKENKQDEFDEEKIADFDKMLRRHNSTHHKPLYSLYAEGRIKGIIAGWLPGKMGKTSYKNLFIYLSEIDPEKRPDYIRQYADKVKALKPNASAGLGEWNRFRKQVIEEIDNLMKKSPLKKESAEEDEPIKNELKIALIAQLIDKTFSDWSRNLRTYLSKAAEEDLEELRGQLASLSPWMGASPYLKDVFKALLGIEALDTEPESRKATIFADIKQGIPAELKEEISLEDKNRRRQENTIRGLKNMLPKESSPDELFALYQMVLPEEADVKGPMLDILKQGMASWRERVEKRPLPEQWKGLIELSENKIPDTGPIFDELKNYAESLLNQSVETWSSKEDVLSLKPYYQVYKMIAALKDVALSKFLKGILEKHIEALIILLNKPEHWQQVLHYFLGDKEFESYLLPHLVSHIHTAPNLETLAPFIKLRSEEIGGTIARKTLKKAIVEKLRVLFAQQTQGLSLEQMYPIWQTWTGIFGNGGNLKAKPQTIKEKFGREIAEKIKEHLHTHMLSQLNTVLETPELRTKAELLIKQISGGKNETIQRYFGDVISEFCKTSRPEDHLKLASLGLDVEPFVVLVFLSSWRHIKEKPWTPDQVVLWANLVSDFKEYQYKERALKELESIFNTLLEWLLKENRNQLGELNAIYKNLSRPDRNINEGILKTYREFVANIFQKHLHKETRDKDLKSNVAFLAKAIGRIGENEGLKKIAQERLIAVFRETKEDLSLNDIRDILNILKSADINLPYISLRLMEMYQKRLESELNGVRSDLELLELLKSEYEFYEKTDYRYSLYGAALNVFSANKKWSSQFAGIQKEIAEWVDQKSPVKFLEVLKKLPPVAASAPEGIRKSYQLFLTFMRDEMVRQRDVIGIDELNKHLIYRQFQCIPQYIPPTFIPKKGKEIKEKAIYESVKNKLSWAKPITKIRIVNVSTNGLELGLAEGSAAIDIEFTAEGSHWISVREMTLKNPELAVDIATVAFSEKFLLDCIKSEIQGLQKELPLGYIRRLSDLKKQLDIFPESVKTSLRQELDRKLQEALPEFLKSMGKVEELLELYKMTKEFLGAEFSASRERQRLIEKMDRVLFSIPMSEEILRLINSNYQYLDADLINRFSAAFGRLSLLDQAELFLKVSENQEMPASFNAFFEKIGSRILEEPNISPLVILLSEVCSLGGHPTLEKFIVAQIQAKLKGTDRTSTTLPLNISQSRLSGSTDFSSPKKVKPENIIDALPALLLKIDETLSSLDSAASLSELKEILEKKYRQLIAEDFKMHHPKAQYKRLDYLLGTANKASHLQMIAYNRFTRKDEKGLDLLSRLQILKGYLLEGINSRQNRVPQLVFRELREILQNKGNRTPEIIKMIREITFEAVHIQVGDNAITKFCAEIRIDTPDKRKQTEQVTGKDSHWKEFCGHFGILKEEARDWVVSEECRTLLSEFEQISLPLVTRVNDELTEMVAEFRSRISQSPQKFASLDETLSKLEICLSEIGKKPAEQQLSGILSNLSGFYKALNKFPVRTTLAPAEKAALENLYRQIPTLLFTLVKEAPLYGVEWDTVLSALRNCDTVPVVEMSTQLENSSARKLHLLNVTDGKDAKNSVIKIALSELLVDHNLAKLTLPAAKVLLEQYIRFLPATMEDGVGVYIKLLEEAIQKDDIYLVKERLKQFKQACLTPQTQALKTVYLERIIVQEYEDKEFAGTEIKDMDIGQCLSGLNALLSTLKNKESATKKESKYTELIYLYQNAFEKIKTQGMKRKSLEVSEAKAGYRFAVFDMIRLLKLMQFQLIKLDMAEEDHKKLAEYIQKLLALIPLTLRKTVSLPLPSPIASFQPGMLKYILKEIRDTEESYYTSIEVMSSQLYGTLVENMDKLEKMTSMKDWGFSVEDQKRLVSILYGEWEDIVRIQNEFSTEVGFLRDMDTLLEKRPSELKELLGWDESSQKVIKKEMNKIARHALSRVMLLKSDSKVLERYLGPDKGILKALLDDPNAPDEETTRFIENLIKNPKEFGDNLKPAIFDFIVNLTATLFQSHLETLAASSARIIYIFDAITETTARASFTQFYNQHFGTKPDVSQFNFPHYLIMPVQRIPRYILLLKEVLKHIPEGAGSNNLSHVISTLERSTKAMNNTKPELQAK